MSSTSQALRDVHNIHPATGAQYAVDARDLADDISSIALGQAASRDQFLTGALTICKFSEHPQ
jgi:hypothetical protein